MFIGHYAPAFIAAAATRRTVTLGPLFVAAQLVDLAFMCFVLVGIEHLRLVPGITAMNPMDLYDMPITHSLLGAVTFGIGFGFLIWLARRDLLAASIGAAVVISHWFLDLLVHRPDLTLAGSPPKLGFGLWNYPLIEMPLEALLVFGSFAWFLRRTRGPIGWAIALGVAMAAFMAIDWFGPKPTEMTAMMSISALFAYLVLTSLAWKVGATRRLGT